MTEQPENVDQQIGADPADAADGSANDNETYHGYSVDDETQPQDTGDSLADSDRGVADPLHEGYSPPDADARPFGPAIAVTAVEPAGEGQVLTGTVRDTHTLFLTAGVLCGE